MKPILSILFLAAAALRAQGGLVEGKVVTTTDASPVRKADVLLRAAALAGDKPGRPGRDNYLARTDSNGRFSIAGVAPGNYECVASRVGFAALPPDRYANAATVPRIAVENGARVADLVLRLTPLGVVTGHVLDAEGYPVSSASVRAVHYSYEQGKKVLTGGESVKSDDRGEYRIYDLFPGTYYLRVRAPADDFVNTLPVRGGRPPLGYRSTYYPSALEAAQAAPVEAMAGGETRSIDIRLQPLKTFTVRGKLPASGSPARWRNLELWVQKRPVDPDSQENYRTSRDADGWEADLPSGSYVVQLDMTDPATNARQVGRAIVEVASADLDGVELSFAPGPEISGTVKFAGTGAVALDSLIVSLAPVEEGRQAGVRAKADGTLTPLNMLPGVYRIRVDPDDKVYPKSIKLGNRELADRLVDLTTGAGGALAIVVASDFGAVQGTVTDAAGTPAPDHNVTLIPDQTKADWANWFREALTDRQGRFAIHGVAPGRYTAFAWQDAPRGAPQNAEFREPFASFGQTVTVEAAGQQTLELKGIVTQKP